MLAGLYKLLGAMLYGFSYIFKGKYVFGLLIYALLFKILFLPFTIKQQKNQIKMAKLTPQIELIKAKYKGRTDQPTMQKQQQEIMELQQKEGYSPFSGCLTLLLQFPVIIFLYNVIRGPLSYICGLSKDAIAQICDIIGFSGNTANEIEIVGAINAYRDAGNSGLEGFDLTRLPDFTLFGTDLSGIPSFQNINWLIAVPVLAAVLTWLSMFLTRRWNNNPATNPAGDAQAKASMKIMDLMMPAMTLWMAFSFSGMLGIYWAYQSALGILQTYIISKAMPLPKFTEEELKEMRKAQKAAEKAQRSAAKVAPKYRSLHYIDDEDYEILPELTEEQKTTKKAPEGMDIPEIKD